MKEERSRFGLRNLLALGALAAWCLAAAAFGPELGLPGRDLGSLVAGLSRQGLWFVPIGLLVPLALPRMRGLFTSFFFVLLPSLALGAALAALVAAAPDIEPWRVFDNFVPPEPLTLLAPLAGMFAGVLLGVVLARGIGSALLLIPALAAIGAILLAIVAVALLVLTDRMAAAEPLGPPGPPTGEYRSAFAALYRGGPAGAPVALDAPAVESAFRRALLAAGVSSEARLWLAPAGDLLEFEASFPWRLPLLGERFLNLVATLEPGVENGDFRAGFRSLRIGGLRIPAVWVRPASRMFSRWLRRYSVAAPLLAQFDGVLVEQSRLIVWRAARRHPLPGSSPLPDDYLALLDRDAELIRSRPDRLAEALERTFALAARRSQDGSAVLENRAALLALGGAAGHPSLLLLAGLPAGGRARGLSGRLVLTLNGRRDWARHFLLSAGLTQVAPGGVSDEVGFLKEQLDAEDGGKGFSFADLLMDRAGARFGLAATANEAAARRMQQRLAGGIAESDLAPGDAGLPEGLSTARLETELGGFRGDGFRALEAEIARRLDELPLYRRGGAPPRSAGGVAAEALDSERNGAHG